MEASVRFQLEIVALESMVVFETGGGTKITNWEADLLCDNEFPLYVGWHQKWTDDVAQADGISPPTGLELKSVLERYHGKFTDKPVRFQVIRW